MSATLFESIITFVALFDCSIYLSSFGSVSGKSLDPFTDCAGHKWYILTIPFSSQPGPPRWSYRTLQSSYRRNCFQDFRLCVS